jgi:hypothetical protein
MLIDFSVTLCVHPYAIASASNKKLRNKSVGHGGVISSALDIIVISTLGLCSGTRVIL